MLTMCGQKAAKVGYSVLETVQTMHRSRDAVLQTGKISLLQMFF